VGELLAVVVGRGVNLVAVIPHGFEDRRPNLECLLSGRKPDERVAAPPLQHGDEHGGRASSQ
jgi:hypothetical protein